MSSTHFDPYRREQLLFWQNRIARWRAAIGETIFHALSLCALVAVALWSLPALFERIDLWRAAASALARWPVPIGVATFLLMILRQNHVLTMLQQKRADDWLGLQPIPDTVHRHRRRVLRFREATLQIALGAFVVFVSGAPRWWLAFLVVAAVVTMLLAPITRKHRGTQAAWNLRRRSAIVDAGIGRLWRWQKIEAGFAFRGRSIAGGALILLLIPIGSSAIAVVVCFAAGLAVAALSSAWSRSLGVLPAAQAWLAPQPLHGARLVIATSLVPSLLLASAVLLVLLGCVALGAARFGALAATALAALGILQFACVAAERTRPRRSGIVFVLHLTLLIGVLQAMPMAAPPLWLAQVGILLRAAVRTR